MSNASIQVPEHQHCIFCGLNANVTVYCSAPHNTMPPLAGGWDAGKRPHAYLPTGRVPKPPVDAAQDYADFGKHILGCDEAHQHRAPKCCAANCPCKPAPQPKLDWVEAAAVDLHYPCGCGCHDGTNYAADQRPTPCSQCKKQIANDVLKIKLHAPKPDAGKIAEAVRQVVRAEYPEVRYAEHSLIDQRVTAAIQSALEER